MTPLYIGTALLMASCVALYVIDRRMERSDWRHARAPTQGRVVDMQAWREARR